MKKFLILVFLFWTSLSFASEERQPVQAMLAYGTEYRPERDLENNFVGHNLTNYAIGAGYQSFVVIFERATFKETTGNATLNVDRLLEDMMLWGQYEAEKWKFLIPTLGGGLGAYRETITTNLAGADSVSRATDYKLLTGMNFGIRFDIRYIWLSLEARLLFGDELDQQGATGGLLRLGLVF